MRDTCQRKRIQMNSRKYHRSSKKLEDRQAHVNKPDPGDRELQALGGRRPIPRGRMEGRVLAPEYLNPDAIHDPDQQHLGEHRISQTERRRYGAIEPRQAALGDQIAVMELLHHQPHAPVNDKLRKDQQRQRHQKADMNFHVQQERHGGAPAQQLPFQSREQEKGQPGEQRDDEDPLHQEFKSVSGEMRPAQKLEERPPQDERKLLGFKKLWFVHIVGFHGLSFLWLFLLPGNGSARLLPN